MSMTPSPSSSYCLLCQRFAPSLPGYDNYLVHTLICEYTDRIHTRCVSTNGDDEFLASLCCHIYCLIRPEGSQWMYIFIRKQDFIRKQGEEKVYDRRGNLFVEHVDDLRTMLSSSMGCCW